MLCGEWERSGHNLINWVKDYETRKDEYGLRRHRALYESFAGTKRECRHPEVPREQ